MEVIKESRERGVKDRYKHNINTNKYKYKYKYRLYQVTSLAWSIVLIGGCNANTTTGRSGRDLTCDWPFKGQPLLAIQHTSAMQYNCNTCKTCKNFVLHDITMHQGVIGEVA